MIAILQRELTIALRRGGPYALVAANAGLLAVLAAIVAAVAGTISPWVAPSIGATASSTPVGLGPTLIAWRGPVLFYLLAAWLALVLTATAPVIGARSFGVERATAALDTLVGSGVSPYGIVLGKALGATVQAALFLLSGLPAFALVWVFGGVGATVVGLTFGLLLAYTLFLVALGVLTGVAVRGDMPATTLAIFAGFVLLMATLASAPLGLLAGTPRPVAALATINPLLGLMLANQDLTDAIGRAGPALLTGMLKIGASTVVIPGLSPPGTAAGAFVVLALALFPLAAAVLDPYHPIKTLRVRRSE